MHHTSITRRLRWLCLLVVLGAATPASACTIPVFRYALERWELSTYELIVFHRGELPSGVQTYLDSLPRKANVTVTVVDVEGKLDPRHATVWEAQGRPATLPWVVVRRADAGAKTAPAWSGPLAPPKLQQFIDSPARQRAVAALSNGSSGLFVLLLSGEPAADAAATSLVQQQLSKLERLVKLPEQRGEGPRIRLALPLQVSFTVLPLKRDEPGEEAFIQLLLGSEDGLASVRGPIVFPIFGRGRLLGSLYGKDLDADNLFEVVSFLCGECSCQVKDLNPGMDLPITADWPAIFERIGPVADTGPESPPGTTRFGARAKPLPEITAIAAGTSKPAAAEPRVALSNYLPESPDAAIDSLTRPMPPPTITPPAPHVEPALHRRWLWGGAMAAGVLVLITGAWAFRQGRRGR